MKLSIVKLPNKALNRTLDRAFPSLTAVKRRLSFPLHILSAQVTIRSVIAILTLTVSFMANADSWPAPQEKGLISSEGSVVVKVIPGESFGESFGFAGEKTGRYAAAKFLRWNGSDGYRQYQEIELLNPVAPIEALIHDDGTLVTLDNWHNMGYGNVVVIYKPDGSILKSYRLADLYKTEKIEQFEHSVSSVWWRCNTRNPRLSYHFLELIDSFGAVLRFDLKTGEFTYSKLKQICGDDMQQAD